MVTKVKGKPSKRKKLSLFFLNFRGVKCENCEKVAHKQCCRIDILACKKSTDLQLKNYNQKGQLNIELKHKFVEAQVQLFNFFINLNKDSEKL